MPTPAKTSADRIVGIARALVETSGPEALTMGAVASEAGVKPPSLYKHFADRAALLKAVEIAIMQDLESTLRRENEGPTPPARLASLAASYRRFAKAAPNRYRAIYSGEAFTDPEIREVCLFAAQPLFEALRAAGVAEARVLPLARTFTAFLHGFVLMEIGNAFNLGGSVDEAFESGLATLLRDL
ncbi:TetR/AcrR family transcriptional regulator [Devosia sp.]|uniref:TetR/AcrR family transcriptional regulator n=1 Tax=Devosia sp. TaxID=1871048 RepID=UPI003A8F871E